MKGLICVCLLLAMPAAQASQDSLSPVSRVVELLRGLSKQIEKEGEKEEDLYETFVCWANSVIEQKTASNAAAASRIDKLETYIADLNSGRIELTSERGDLEKEIAELMGDMEVAKSMRAKENKDFLDAEDEMKKAVAALKSASDVLGEATKKHKEGVLVAVRTRLNGGMAALAQQTAQLKYAVELGSRFLTKADSVFLRRLLTGDVPNVDWKKLNRKATFKMAYKARSFKIQDVLNKMHQTFSTNLADAREKDAAAHKSSEALTKSKGDPLSTAQTALTKMESENGAKGMSKQDSQDEVDSLKKAVSNDEKFIAQTEKALADKKGQWKDRQELRAGEVAAISKAIQILNNDDARDNFKKSFKSQGFVQLSANDKTEHMVSLQNARASNQAAVQLRKAALATGSQELLALARMVASPSVKGKFGPVISAVDKMIALLKGQETTDLETKQTCEKDRMADTKDAIDASRDMDDMTDKMTRLSEEIKTLAGEIADLVAEQKKVTEELAKATQMRKDEHAEWVSTDKDDKLARDTVQNAKDVLTQFYKDNNMVFVQKAHQPAVTAGDAPPPPPATWGGDYGGKTGESQGIVAILGMVKQDIEKDIASAKSEEDASQKEFDSFKSDSEDKLKALKSEENKKDGLKGKKETAKTDTQKQRGTKNGELGAIMQKINDVNPNCEYFEVNYPLRLKNRQIEMDGLAKAKAILQGGTFTENTDATREIKPGDAALVQSLRR